MTPETDILAPRVLRSSRLRTLALLAFCVLASVCGLVMVRTKADYGWQVLAFGVVGVAVLGFIFIRPNRLELSARGLTTVTLGRRWSVDWGECGEFSTWTPTLTSPAVVVFDRSKPAVREHPLAGGGRRPVRDELGVARHVRDVRGGLGRPPQPLSRGERGPAAPARMSGRSQPAADSRRRATALRSATKAPISA